MNRPCPRAQARSMLAINLRLFQMTGVDDATARREMTAIARSEYIQARQAHRTEQAAHWRAYHRYTAACAVATLMELERDRT